jgi:cell division protein FtsZ
MSEMGMAMIGSGFAEGSDRAEIAAKSAVACPLLEDVNLNNAKGILVNISASKDFKMKEYFEIMDIIKQYASENATIIVGNVIDESMSNSIRVTMVATGLTGSYQINEQNESVMQAFVYDDKDKSTKESEDEDNPKEDESLNVFADNSNNNNQTFSSDNDDEYDIPAFLRKNK